MSYLNNDIIEQAALELLRKMDYSYAYGGAIAPGEPRAARSNQGWGS